MQMWPASSQEHWLTSAAWPSVHCQAELVISPCVPIVDLGAHLGVPGWPQGMIIVGIQWTGWQRVFCCFFCLFVYCLAIKAIGFVNKLLSPKLMTTSSVLDSAVALFSGYDLDVLGPGWIIGFSQCLSTYTLHHGSNHWKKLPFFNDETNSSDNHKIMILSCNYILYLISCNYTFIYFYFYFIMNSCFCLYQFEKRARKDCSFMWWVADARLGSVTSLKSGKKWQNSV